MKKLKTYIEDENFVPDKVERVSKAAHALCVWVLAMDKYAKVSKEVEPKRMKLEEAEEKLSSAKAILEEKQVRFFEINFFLCVAFLSIFSPRILAILNFLQAPAWNLDCCQCISFVIVE